MKKKKTKSSPIPRWLLALSFILLIGLAFEGAFLTKEGLSFSQTLQYLADPYLRYVKIEPGLRKEQIADIYARVLDWNEQDKKDFAANIEGHYFPQTYLVPYNADGKEIGATMVNTFNQNIGKETAKNNKKIINADTAVKIASIIQREAAGKQDMNLISGIIWNRLFNGMSLDMDATLQYAKGSDLNGWWPQVVSGDKKINSPYNTYKNKGLPPTPISNPGLSAIDAAFNPQNTSCLFYFHDKNRQIHCSVTYEEHQQKIKQYLASK